MTGHIKYVLDANVFIEAKNRYYAFDLVPKFWSILIDQADNGRILSIDRVKEELERGKDELAAWVKEKFDNAFVSTDDEDVIQSYSKVMSWVQAHPQFTDGAKADFAKGADGWLVAYAKVNGCVVVTHEQPSTDVKTRVPIPNVCQAFNVLFDDTFKMLRKLGVKIA